MGLFQGASVLRAGVDRVLKSDAVMGALQRRVGRYVDILDLCCPKEGGLMAVVRLKGLSEEVRVVLRRAEIGENGDRFRPVDIGADCEGVDALLKDLVQGRSFELPPMVKPFAGMLKSLFS